MDMGLCRPSRIASSSNYGSLCYKIAYAHLETIFFEVTKLSIQSVQVVYYYGVIPVLFGVYAVYIVILGYVAYCIHITVAGCKHRLVIAVKIFSLGTAT